MERSPNAVDTDKRVRQSTKQSVLEVLGHFKSDLEINPEAFDGGFYEYPDDQGITKLFEAAGMDRRKVAHWQAILVACSKCLFPEDEEFSPKGRRTEWTEEVQDSLIGWWFTARQEFGDLGEHALFEAMINKYGPFEIAPSHVMSDPESLRLRFQMVKATAKAAVQNDWAREMQTRLIQAMAKEEGR